MFLKFYFVFAVLNSDFAISAEINPLTLGSSNAASSAPTAPPLSYASDASSVGPPWQSAQSEPYQQNAPVVYDSHDATTSMYPHLYDTPDTQSQSFSQYSHTSSYSSEPPILATPPYPQIAYELPYVQNARAHLVPSSSFTPLSHSPEKNSAEYELGISAFKLQKKDFFSKSDPICIVKVPAYREGLKIIWKEYSRTNPLQNTHEPVFTDKIVIRYFFDTLQPLRFELYDVNGSALGRLLGFVEMELGDLTQREYTEKNLQTIKRGKVVNLDSLIVVRSEELTENKDQVTLQFMGKHLPYVKLFAIFTRNLYIQIYKVNESGHYIPVHKTETVAWSYKTMWQPFTVEVRKLNNGDNDMSLKFILFSENNCAPDTELGEFQTTIRELASTRMYHLSKEDKTPEQEGKHKKKKKSKTYGEIHIVQYNYMDIPTFTKYLRGGLQLNGVVSIDFTISNQCPDKPTSLHYWGPEMNQYEITIYEVVSILAIYDYDNKFPTIGFGAKLPPDYGTTSHAFNIHEFNQDCDGVWDILIQYRKCLHRIQFSQPTHFAPSIDHAIAEFGPGGRLQDNGDVYLVLLILTDGQILDPAPTKRALVRASYLPMSIIIVGIGNGIDLREMEILDADADPFVIDGQSCRHDITQFVSFEQVKAESNLHTAPQLLAQRLLEEVPRQLISHMMWRGFRPKPPNNMIFTLPPDPASL